LASTAELLRRLKRAGFVLAKHGKRHDIYEHPSGRRVIIWRHAREIPNGTYRSILKDAGLSDED